MQRLLYLILSLTVLVIGLGSALPSASLVLDWSTLVLVLVLPLAAVSVSDSPIVPMAAIGAGLRDSQDLAPGERRHMAAVLRSLGQASVGVGLVLGLLTIVGTFNEIAGARGQPDMPRSMLAFGGLVLGPVYGLVAKGFFYDPLADAVEDSADGLGELLQGVEGGEGQQSGQG